MKVACVIFLYTKNDTKFLWLTIACARSIRLYDDIPIYALIPHNTTGPNVIKRLSNEDIGIWIEPALYRKCCFPYQTTKIQAIKHTEFDKLVLIDADFIATESVRNLFNSPSLSAAIGRYSPLSAGMIVIEPNRNDYNNVMKVYKKGFDTKTGWGNHGPICHWQTGKEMNWTFNGAHVEQGLLYYYYGLLKKRLYQPEYFPFRNMNHKKPVCADVYTALGIEPRLLEKGMKFDIGRITLL